MKFEQRNDVPSEMECEEFHPFHVVLSEGFILDTIFLTPVFYAGQYYMHLRIYCILYIYKYMYPDIFADGRLPVNVYAKQSPGKGYEGILR